eukprot:121554_1
MASICFLITLLMVINTVQPETKLCAGVETCKCDNKGPCQLECIGHEACKGSSNKLECKENYPCTIICDAQTGSEACLDLEIVTAGASSVTVHCIGASSCKTSVLNCGDTEQCDINCNDDTSSCEGMDLNCGHSSCTLDCAGAESCKAMTVSISDAESFECTKSCTGSGMESIPSPSAKPTAATPSPSGYPSQSPSGYPTESLPIGPSIDPTKYPSVNPSRYPTNIPSRFPSGSPTKYPSVNPTNVPSVQPSKYPSMNPINVPSKYPTESPSSDPSTAPIIRPTNDPTPVSNNPTNAPTNAPTKAPTTTRLHVDHNQPSLPTYAYHSQERIETTAAQSSATVDGNHHSDNENNEALLDEGWLLIAGISASIVCICVLICVIYCRMKKKYSIKISLSKHGDHDTNADSHELTNAQRNGEPRNVHVVPAMSPTSTAQIQFGYGHGESNVDGIGSFDGGLSCEYPGEGANTADTHEMAATGPGIMDDDIDILSGVNTLGGDMELHVNEESQDEDDIIAGVNTLGGDDLQNDNYSQELEDEDVIAGGNTFGEGHALPTNTGGDAVEVVDLADDEFIVGDDETDMGTTIR